MTIDDLTFNAMYSVLQSGMWLLNDLETFLRPYDLSQARLSILLAIQESEEGNINPNVIAGITGKSRPAITRTIEKLSKDGLIAVEQDLADGRGKKLRLTAASEELLEEIVPEYNKRICEMSSSFSESDKEQLISLLKKINFLDKEKVLR